MYRNLVLSGGSIKGVAYIGCIRFLEESGIIHQFKNLIGSSVGSIVCLLICLGISCTEMTQFMKKLFSDYHTSTPNVDNIINIFNTMGLDDGSLIMKHIVELLHTKYNLFDITFIDLAKRSGKNLVVCGTNLTTAASIYFNVDTYPNMSVLKAIRISISIPFIFTPVLYENAIYADAALFNNFPIDYFDGSLPQNTLGIVIKSKQEEFDTSSFNIVKYISCLIDAHYFKINGLNFECYKNNNKIVTLNLPSSSTYHFDFKKFKFDLSPTDMENYTSLGYEIIKQHFD